MSPVQPYLQWDCPIQTKFFTSGMYVLLMELPGSMWKCLDSARNWAILSHASVPLASAIAIAAGGINRGQGPSRYLLVQGKAEGQFGREKTGRGRMQQGGTLSFAITCLNPAAAKLLSLLSSFWRKCPKHKPAFGLSWFFNWRTSLFSFIAILYEHQVSRASAEWARTLIAIWLGG